MVTALLSAGTTWAANPDRVVTLTPTANVERDRIEIRNPSSETISFTLGLNDQLFENQQSLLAAIRSSPNQSCVYLHQPELTGPCNAFERVAAAMIHFTELTDQFDANGWAGKPRLWFESPMLAINSFGLGTCGTFTDVLAKIWKSLGYEARRRTMNGHAVSEVRVGGRWLLFDADLRGFFADRGLVLGLDDLVEDPTLAHDPLIVRPLPGVRECDFPHADLTYYTYSLLSDPGRPPGIEEAPEADTDWRDLTITMPPGSRLIFPETSPSRCLFPELSNFSPTDEFGDLTNPSHRYAVLEIPAGTIADIQNGLYPTLVTGNYSLTAVYAEGTETTDHFNQGEQFRFARRFAREFRHLETESDVRIYYMLTANISLEAVNEVRVHGENVGELEIELNEPRPTVGTEYPPCIAPPSAKRVDVRNVSTSSNENGDRTLQGNLIDGSLLTSWRSDLIFGDAPQVITLDVGRPKVIGGIRWAPDASYGMLSPSDITVETSIFGRSYREAVRVSDYRPSRVDWLERQFQPRLARFVRMTLTPRPHFLAPGYFMVLLSEIEVLRPRAAAPPEERVKSSD